MVISSGNQSTKRQNIEQVQIQNVQQRSFNQNMSAFEIDISQFFKYNIQAKKNKHNRIKIEELSGINTHMKGFKSQNKVN
mmetsp:Transcript_11162/g.11231  ORF Transcript_11162/g.11231 Transcript_11162/m.11231 type:complete len:80 (+) Transcript_11162:352-591(+)